MPPPQQWPAYGRQGQPVAVRGYPSAGFGQPSFGGGIPHYGPAPTLPGPPRQRHPLRLVLMALIGVATIALLGLVAVGLASGPPSVQYQNDDYKVPPPDANPPPIPAPETYGQAESYIARNPFYGQMAPAPVRCDSQPINVTTASDDQLKTHFEGLMECLVRVWQPPVTGAGFEIVRPTVTIYDQEITTKCGKSGVNAFYCSGDQQVYYSNQLPGVLPREVRQDKWTSDVVMAHEFGHALQGRTGILISAHALGQNSNDEATDLQYTRRLETQADCFSGMFVRAVSRSLGVEQTDLKGIEDIYTAIGDDTLSRDAQVVGNHGLARSRKLWGTRGLATSAVGKCNTFVAPASEVR
jgi:predicted metalloprotease